MYWPEWSSTIVEYCELPVSTAVELSTLPSLLSMVRLVTPKPCKQGPAPHIRVHTLRPAQSCTISKASLGGVNGEPGTAVSEPSAPIWYPQIPATPKRPVVVPSTYRYLGPAATVTAKIAGTLYGFPGTGMNAPLLGLTLNPYIFDNEPVVR